MKAAIRSGIIAMLFFLPVRGTHAEGDDLYFIDAHSQVDQKVVPMEKVMSIMEEGGVRHTILSGRGSLTGKDLIAFAAQYPDGITPAVRTKVGPYESGSARYFKALKGQVGSGKYSAMAEVLLYHAKKGSKAPEVTVYPDDKRVRAALNYAIENDWPFVVHIEFASLQGEERKKFMRALKQMLAQHPEHPFVLTHMGQLTGDRCLRLIENHKNVYFHTGWTNPAAVESSNQPWTNIFEGDRIAPEWKDLFLRYPGRFIFALDNVFSEHWSAFYTKQMNYWKSGLAELPAEAAHLIAHGNAERLWGIHPRR